MDKSPRKLPPLENAPQLADQDIQPPTLPPIEKQESESAVPKMTVNPDNVKVGTHRLWSLHEFYYTFNHLSNEKS